MTNDLSKILMYTAPLAAAAVFEKIASQDITP